MHCALSQWASRRLWRTRCFFTSPLVVGAAIRWIRDNAAAHGIDPKRIFAMGHSAGAVHLASYLADKGAGDALLAGAILGSGMYDLESRKPAPNILAYYGEDIAKFRERSPIYGLQQSQVPLLIFVSELDSADFQEQGLKLIQALFERNGKLPRFMRLYGHNHYSPTMHINAGDDQDALSNQILDFVANGH